ncbi:MAG: hypothetical protein SP1CHLAM54_03300 [Chlamydiia bacterium]|nr:hypothetical protein [Chlamydiia bacterium]MCH9615246.1 hypothetical protein [Chlamydiia bacterium]MCH9628432.1 hypothetical protein [Chlamydiia bacterium]
MEPYLFVLKQGQPIMETLTKHVAEKGWSSCSVSGIGAVVDPEVAFFFDDTKDYTSEICSGQYEVISINGNVAWFEGELMAHLHILLGDEKYKTFGGHLMDATVGPTLELTIVPMKAKYARKFDEEVGIKLIQH